MVGPVSVPAIRYLRRHEWRMGNGQCPECCGHDPTPGMWDGRGTVGHRPGCDLAAALKSLGEPVDYERPAPPPGPATAEGQALIALREWSRKVTNRAYARAFCEAAKP